MFGKYRLIAKLATGGMADIFLASYTGLGGFEKVLVLKKILPNLLEEPKFIEMFLDEARIAAMLNHPNVIQIYDLGRVGRDYFIAMEYLAGESLSQIIKTCRKLKRQFPYWLAAAVIAQAADGLDHAHQATGKDGLPLGIVHRDVSPQNIFVLYEGGVKVVDFGIARAAARTTKTRTGTLKGKYAYMSPEQVAGKEIDRRSDIFSLGVVFWECLAQRKLFNQDNDLDLLKAVVGGDIPDPFQHAPALPQELGRICLKALARERGQRYQTAAELASDIRKFLKASAYEWDSQALAAFMKEIFSERMAKKKEIVERSLTGSLELENSLFGDVGGVISDTEFSVPRTTPSHIRKEMKGRRRSFTPARVLSFGAIIVAAAVLAGFLIFRQGGDKAGDRQPPPPRPGEAEVTGSPQAGAPSIPPDSLSTPANKPDGEGAKIEPPVEKPSPVDSPKPQDPGATAAAVKKGDSKVAKKTPKVVAKKSNDTAKKPENPLPPQPPGKLRLMTNPWAEVFYQGKSLGQTPLVDVSLPSGLVELLLVNAEKGIKKNVVVKIRPGETTVEKLNLF